MLQKEAGLQTLWSQNAADGDKQRGRANAVAAAARLRISRCLAAFARSMYAVVLATTSKLAQARGYKLRHARHGERAEVGEVLTGTLRLQLAFLARVWSCLPDGWRRWLEE